MAASRKAAGIEGKQRKGNLMKIDQTQFQGGYLPESVNETATGAVKAHGLKRSRSDNDVEEELNKLFLTRLDVSSRIADLHRNHAKLRAQKIDVQSKIAFLCEFDAKLMKREEELSQTSQ